MILCNNCKRTNRGKNLCKPYRFSVYVSAQKMVLNRLVLAASHTKAPKAAKENPNANANAHDV